MKRGLSLFLAATFAAAPLAASAQEPKKDETQPSQQSSATPPAAEKPAPAAKPAAPAAPAVTLYGTINLNTQWTRARGGAAAPVSPRYAVSTDSTNIGVRGGAQVTDWARAEFQCETQANLDGINAIGLCNRNSRIGLSGGFGTLFYGNWDTPHKAATYGTKADDPFGNTDVFGFQGIMGSPGFNYRTSAWKTATADVIGGFDVRASNSIGYWTPKYYGLTARFQGSTNEFKSANAALSPKLWSAALIYDRGPFSITASGELHEDAFALAGANAGAVAGPPAQPATATFGATAGNNATAHTEDWTWRVSAGYELATGFGATRLMAGVEQIVLQQFRAPTGAIKEYDRFAWQVGVSQRIAAHELRARYSMADDGDCELVGGGACSTSDYGAQMYTLGYAYHLAKTTQVYLYWAHILNDTNAQYTFTNGGAPAVTGAAGVRGTTARGQDPEAAGLGIRHAF